MGSDIRLAFRLLAKSPAFTLTALLALALGIGANSVIFSAVNALLFHPVGISEPERVVAIRTKYEKLNLQSIVISAPTFADVRDSKDVFAAAAIVVQGDLSYTAGDYPERLSTRAVTSQWFDVFGAKPILGRVFRPEEDQPNQNHVVVLDYGMWQRFFGGDPSIVEKTIQLNEEPYKVIGVMGPEFSAPNQDLWLPLGLPADAFLPTNRHNEGFVGVARLQPGISFEKAQAYMGVLTQHGFDDAANGAYAKDSRWGVFAVPYTDFVVGDLKTPMFVLLGAVGFVLLIACSNIAGLMLARASGQAREWAVRTALGANRWHLIRQTLAESLLLAMGGTLLGLLVAYGGVRALLRLTPENLVGGLNIRIDMYVLIFTSAIGVLSGVLFGIAPAWQVMRNDTHDSLKEGGRSGTASKLRLRMRSILVTAEVAIAIILLVGAGLFIRSLTRLQQVETGFRPAGVMTGIVSLPPAQYTEPEKRTAFFRSVIERMEAIPGVTAVAAGMPFPFFGGSSASFNIEGRDVGPGDPGPHGDVRWVSSGFFSTLGIPLKNGRVFSEQDGPQSEPVVVIDENLAKQYWPNENPVGKRLRRGRAPWCTIVGVVGHVKHSELAADSGKGVYYYPMLQQPRLAAGLLIRTSGDPSRLSNALREAVRSVNPAQPLSDLKSMDERVAATLGGRRFAVTLLGLFAAIALFMAALGLYGVISYGVTQRTHEIGIRLALGAQPGQLLGWIVGQGLRLTLVGIAVGSFFAFALSRMLANQLFGIRAFDPLTFIVMAVVLLLVSFVASYVPARRATKVDPLEACRYE